MFDVTVKTLDGRNTKFSVEDDVCNVSMYTITNILLELGFGLGLASYSVTPTELVCFV